MKMKISIVIPAYNEELYIGECLDHIIRHSGGTSAETVHEIIVVDNGSTDRTREIALKRPGVKVVTEKVKGLTRARQRGLEEATGDYIAYLDADTRMPKDWLAKAQHAFEKQDVVSVSGPYRYYDGTVWKNRVMNTLWYVSAPLMFRLVGYMVLGGNFIAKKEALVAMGGFDKSIDFYGEDTDIARRLSKHGKVLFRMDFFIHSSSRRLNSEGLIRTNITYALNFLWEVIFHRPFSSSYRDIRIVSTNDSRAQSKNIQQYEATARNKAILWSVVFGGIGLYALFARVGGVPTSTIFVPNTVLPLFIFYMILVIHTYFSIRHFSNITPRDDTRNNIIDIILGFLFVGMAFSLQNAEMFVFFDLLLFIVAAAKYSFLLGKVGYPRLLRKKILVDISGILLCALVLESIIIGYGFYGSWALCIVFAIANIHVFFVRPLYVYTIEIESV